MRTLIDGPMMRLPVSHEWTAAGFFRYEATAWRLAGWDDACEAAVWRAASPCDEAAPLRDLHEAGYTPTQLQHVGRVVRRHVAAWTVALVQPERRAEPSVEDEVIDLREPAMSSGPPALQLLETALV